LDFEPHLAMNLIPRALAVAALALSPFVAASQQAPAALQNLDGRGIFLAACATCHGGDGRGSDRALVGFDEELPDFTDCSFASREPAGDWVIVAQQGGPVRGFSEMMPAFGEALDEEQLMRAVAHIQSLCRDRAWPRGELNLPRTLATEKAYPEDEWVLENAGSSGDPDLFEHKLIYEKRFGAKSQLELAIPYAYRRDLTDAQGTVWSGGLGDVSVGLKHVLSHGLESGHILSAVAEVKLPTGEEANGFGAGAFALEGFLTFGKLLPSDGFLQMQGGAERSMTRDAEVELFWTAGLGKTFTQGSAWGRAWSPILEVAGVMEGDEGTFWDILPQLHVTLNKRQHIMLTVGPRIPLGDDERRTVFQLNFLWDWFDGGLRDGW
jgi:mono/diheme cytochrome c family protein